MGTLERIRKTSPYLLALFAILFVAFMVLSDVDVSNILHRGETIQTAVLAEINGEKIYYKDFESRVKEIIERERSQRQDEQAEIDEIQIRQSVWEQMVNELLLSQLAAKAGIKVSDDEILDILIDNPPQYLRQAFSDSAGVFQRESYLQIITNPDIIYSRLPQNMSQQEKKEIVDKWKQDLINIEKDIRFQKLYDNFAQLVNTCKTSLSKNFLEQKFKDEKIFTDVSFIMFDARKIPDTLFKVTNEELMEYYEKNKQYYEQKPKRKVKFVTFPIIPSSKDTANALKAVQKVQKNLEESTDLAERDTIFTRIMREIDYKVDMHDFTSVSSINPQVSPYLLAMTERQVIGPISLPDGIHFYRLDEKRTTTQDSVKASHILINFGTNKDSAKAEANRILNLAKQPGSDFAILATQYSQDKGSATRGGDLGFFGKGMMVKPFEEACFNAKPNSIIGPVETQFGYHIIKVFEKKSTPIQEIKYSEITIAPKITRATEKEIMRNAQELKTAIENGTPIETAIKKFPTIKRVDSVFVEKNRPVPKLNSNYLSAKIYESSVGTVLEPMEIKNQGIVVMQLVEIREAGVQPFSEVETLIKRKVFTRKKLDSLKNVAYSIYSKVKNLDSLSKVTQMFPEIEVKFVPRVNNNGYISGIGSDYVFTTLVQTLPIGKITEPIRGEIAYYIIQPISRQEVDKANYENELTAFKKQLKKGAADQLNPYWNSPQYSWADKLRFSTYIQKIKEEADIKDYRSKYYREY